MTAKYSDKIDKAFWKKHPVFAVLLGLELLAFLWFLAPCFRPASALDLDPLEYLALNGQTDGVEVSEAGGAAKITWGQDHAAFDLSTYNLPLAYGGYEIQLNYTLVLNQPETAAEVVGPQAVLSSASQPGKLHSETFALPANESRAAGWLRLPRLRALEDGQLHIISAAGATGGELLLHSIHLQEMTGYRWLRLFELLLAFAVIDGLFVLFFVCGVENLLIRKGKSLRIAALLVGSVLIASLPFFANYLYMGGDLTFHMARIAALAQELSNHQFPVRIMTTMLSDYSYTTPLFYCDIFLYLPAVLYNWMLPLRTCYQIYAILNNVLTCVFAYYAFRRMAGSREIGAVGASLYTLASYRFENLHIRSAVGEYTAMTFLPLIALGVWAVYTQKKPTARDWLPLAFGVAGVIQCHVLSMEMLAMFLVVFALVLWRKTFAPQRLLALAKAGAVAVGLSAWFLVPFLSLMRHAPIQVDAINYDEMFFGGGLYPIQAFNLFQMGTGGGTATAQYEMHLTIGGSLMIAMAVVAYCWVHQKRWNLAQELRTEQRSMQIAFAWAVGAFVLGAYCFPWQWISDNINAAIPHLIATMQFPWRFLEIATIALAVAVVFALVILQKRKPALLRPAALVMLCASIISAGIFYMHFGNDVGTLTYAGRSDISFTDWTLGGSGHYAPRGGEIRKTVEPLPQEPEVAITQYRYDAGDKYYTCQNQAATEKPLCLPIFKYAYYHVYDTSNGQEFELSQGYNITLQVTLPAGYQGTLLVRYEPPLYWRASEVLTLLTLLGLAAWLAVHQIRCKKGHALGSKG